MLVVTSGGGMRFYSLLLLISMAICFTVLAPIQCCAEEPLLDKAIRDYRNENFEEALENLKSARLNEPESALAAFYLGLTLKQTGDYKGAAEQFREALYLTPPVLDASLELAEALFTLGDTAGARNALETAEKNAVRPAAAAFLKGIVLAKENESDDAITSFTRAKELDPSLAQQVEFQIALLHARERKVSRARDSLKTLIAMNPASEAASMAKEYETTFTRLMEEYKPWHLTIGANYLYDDNVISNPDNDRRLDQPDSDSAFAGSFRIDYSPLIDAPWGISAQYICQTTMYGSLNTMNTLINTVSVTPAYSQRNGASTVPVSYSHILLDDAKYMGMFSVRPTRSFLLPSGHIAQASAGYLRREMLRDPYEPDEERDADIYGAGAAYIAPLGDGKGMLSLRYDFSYDDAIGRNWENRGHRVNLGGNFPVGVGVSIQVNGDIFDQEYLHTHTSYLTTRHDTLYTALAGATWEISENFSLNLQYNHTRSASNIDDYSYRRNTVTVGLEAGF